MPVAASAVPNEPRDPQRIYSIAELAREFALTARTIRVYEDEGLIKPRRQGLTRLYSAGELGSIYSYLYQGTGNIGECLAFGRIAGRNAAAEPVEG